MRNIISRFHLLQLENPLAHVQLKLGKLAGDSDADFLCYSSLFLFFFAFVSEVRKKGILELNLVYE